MWVDGKWCGVVEYCVVIGVCFGYLVGINCVVGFGLVVYDDVGV